MNNSLFSSSKEEDLLPPKIVYKFNFARGDLPKMSPSPFSSAAISLPCGKTLKVSESDSTLIQRNPLDSTASLKFQKQASTVEDDGVVLKSLFDLHKEANFKPLEEFKSELAEKKPPAFKFTTASLPALKPFFPAQTNLFKIPLP